MVILRDFHYSIVWVGNIFNNDPCNMYIYIYSEIWDLPLMVHYLGWCYILTPVLPLWKVLLPTPVFFFVAAVTMKFTSWSKQAAVGETKGRPPWLCYVFFKHQSVEFWRVVSFLYSSSVWSETDSCLRHFAKPFCILYIYIYDIYTLQETNISDLGKKETHKCRLGGDMLGF